MAIRKAIPIPAPKTIKTPPTLTRAKASVLTGAA